jgi:hypothetical protein
MVGFRLVVKAQGACLSREMAQVAYEADYYVHYTDTQLAAQLAPRRRSSSYTTIADDLSAEDINAYAGPVVAQAITEIVQVTPLEQVNEHIKDVTLHIHTQLAEFLAGYGITLETVKVLIHPTDPRMRELIALKAFGLDAHSAVRYYIAILMAEKGVVSAPNMAAGLPYYVDGVVPTISIDAPPYPAQEATAAPPGDRVSRGKTS